MPDGLLDRGQGLLPPSQVGQAVGLVVQRRGEVGQERVGPGLGELAADGDGLLDRGQGLLPPPQVGQAGWTGCSATWRGRAGTRRAGRRRAGGRWLTASSIAARASSRRPRSARRSDWLFSDHGEVGQERVGPGVGELAVDGDGFLDRGQGLLPPPQVGQAERLVVQRRGEVGEERVGPGLGELAVDARGFLDRGQGLLPPPQIAQAVAEIYQPSGALAIVWRSRHQPAAGVRRRQVQRARRRDTGLPQRLA